jgi:hypothetical protein
LQGGSLQQLSRCAVNSVLHHPLSAAVLVQHIGLRLAVSQGNQQAIASGKHTKSY